MSQSVERVKDELRSVPHEMNDLEQYSDEIMYASLGSKNLQIRALRKSFVIARKGLE